MCCPPDLAPGRTEATVDDFSDEPVAWETEGPVAAAPAPVLFSGKRGFDDVLGGLGSSLPAKVPRNSAALDSAAASFMARLEHSMLEGLQQQQQQQMAEEILEEQAKLQQLEQMQKLILLRKLQAEAAAEAIPAIPTQQQQLLLAQKRLLQRSRNNYLSALAAPPAASPAAPSMLRPSSSLSAEAKLNAWLQAATPSGGLSALPGTSSAATPFPLFTGMEMPMASPAMLAQEEEEKKAKRMVSNRASAKRSRQRKQARLEELDKTTASLQEENHMLCEKLEEAQHQISELERKNCSLTGEVATLRKLLGLEGSVVGPSGKAESGMTTSMSSPRASTGEWAGAAAQPVKLEVAEEVVADDLLDGAWELPLPEKAEADAVCSPRSGVTHIPSIDQLLNQDNVFSELLACLEA